MEVLNPLARNYKSIGTMKKELAELQGELAEAHKQVCKVSSHLLSLNFKKHSYSLVHQEDGPMTFSCWIFNLVR